MIDTVIFWKDKKFGGEDIKHKATGNNLIELLVQEHESLEAICL